MTNTLRVPLSSSEVGVFLLGVAPALKLDPVTTLPVFVLPIVAAAFAAVLSWRPEAASPWPREREVGMDSRSQAKGCSKFLLFSGVRAETRTAPLHLSASRVVAIRRSESDARWESVFTNNTWQSEPNTVSRDQTQRVTESINPSMYIYFVYVWTADTTTGFRRNSGKCISVPSVAEAGRVEANDVEPRLVVAAVVGAAVACATVA